MKITVLPRGTKTALGFSQEVRETGIKHTVVRRPLKVPQSTAGSDLDHLPREQMLTRNEGCHWETFPEVPQRSAAL